MSLSPWIKLCHDTPLKPEILEIADILGVSRREAFAVVMEFWLWIDSHSKHGELRRLRVSHVDGVLSQPGLASALLSVGWLAQSEDGTLFVPNYDRHGGETAKERAIRKERNDRHRGKLRRERDEVETPPRLKNVSRSSSISSSCIESSRSEDEEASDAKPTAPVKAPKRAADRPLALEDIDLPADLEPARPAIARWLAFKAKQPKAKRIHDAEAFVAMLSRLGGPEAITASIDASLANGWQGLFPANDPRHSGRGDPNAGLTIQERVRRKLASIPITDGSDRE
ncbi:MAG TPA: hypothetical protein PLI18_16800 [Pirellulaceae bacterium]|nr:hypothetical protein [Pirellulaceae bacterium]